jgi:large subunit ribosomal protein L25
MKQGQFELEVSVRPTGRHNSRVLRKQDMTPGVVYGTGIKGNIHLSAVEKFVRKYATGEFENTILTLKSSDAALNGVKVLLKDIAVHPVTRRPVHMDLWAIDLKKPVRVNVEVRYEGKAIGLADGGVLQSLLREIEVECLPTEIPEFIATDVSNLGVYDTLHISDLKLPAGVKSTAKEDLALVTVTIVKEEVAAPVAVAAAAAEPEVAAKGKKPEEGAAAGAAGAKPAAAAAKPAAKK